jgi:hypothetical protein
MIPHIYFFELRILLTSLYLIILSFFGNFKKVIPMRMALINSIEKSKYPLVVYLNRMRLSLTTVIFTLLSVLKN